jgi:hypothetical protein
MDIKQKISDLESRLQRLDRKFNFYFVGQDKVPPVKDFDLLKHRVAQLTREKERSTSSSLRFYMETFLQKFISYRVKWERGLRDIEEGRLTCGADFFKGRKFARIEMEKIKGQEPMDEVSQETEKDIE